MILNMGGGGVIPKETLDETTITPGTEDQVVDAGTYLRGDLTVAGDPDLVAENIPKDINLFGVQGTRQPDFGLNVWTRASGKLNVSTTISAQTGVTCAVSTPFTIQVTSSNSDYPVSELTTSDLIGLEVQYIHTGSKYKNYYCKITSATKCQVMVEGGSYSSYYDYTFDNSTGIITTSYSISLGDYMLNSVLNTITLSKNETLYAYVVNDDSSTYPDGDFHTDGYYYELLGHIDSANVMSLSDNAVATVQADYRDQIVEEVNS